MATNSDIFDRTALAALNAINGVTHDGDINTTEAVTRLRNLRQCVFHGVPVVEVGPELALERIAEPPQASRPLTLRDRWERVKKGHYEEWKR
jgi:hypothetical protein